jgi:predicted ATPase
VLPSEVILAMQTKCKFIVLTGGPGAGKTAVLEVVRRHFSERVVVLPESASIVFGGGFPRRNTVPAQCAAQRAAQRAIFHVQRELETLAGEESGSKVVLCDRGTLDGLAYWPGEPLDLLGQVRTSMEEELARYAMVIHLRTPSAAVGYNHRNPLRLETAEEAAVIDAKIGAIWARHPHVLVVKNHRRFVEKLSEVLSLLRSELGVAEEVEHAD